MIFLNEGVFLKSGWEYKFMVVEDEVDFLNLNKNYLGVIRVVS